MADDRLNERAAALGRMLTRFQLKANQDWPARILASDLRSIHAMAGELIELLDATDPGTLVRFSPALGDHTASLLAELDKQAPDTIPDDWKDS